MSELPDGPWVAIKSGSFSDPRQHGGPDNPQEYERFLIERQVTARYVKYSCTSYYGSGCALQYIGVHINTSLASEQFVKTRAYHSQWTQHIYFEMGGFESPEHCAIWCRIQHECHLFHFAWANNYCYLGNRKKFRNTSGPKSSSQMDVYWDPGKRINNLIN